jgi:hypothetical protein
VLYHGIYFIDCSDHNVCFVLTFITKRKTITQVLVFTVSIKLKLFIHFSLLHGLAVNYRPSSGNSYIHSTYSVILPLPIGQWLHLGEGRIHYKMLVFQTWNVYI